MSYKRGFMYQKKYRSSCTMSKLVRKMQRQADTKASRFLSSRTSWNRGNLDPAFGGSDLSAGSYLDSLLYVLTKQSDF